MIAPQRTGAGPGGSTRKEHDACTRIGAFAFNRERGDTTTQADAALAFVGSVLAVGFASVAGAAPAGGAVKVFGVPGMGNGSSPILFTGAIGDYGKAIRQNANGVTNKKGDYIKFNLKQGTFIGNGTALFKKPNNATPAFNNTTCSGAFTASASMPLGSGTGAYAGIGGSLNVHVTFAFVGPRFKSGTHKGQCNGNANPLAQIGTISGGGTVSVG